MKKRKAATRSTKKKKSAAQEKGAAQKAVRRTRREKKRAASPEVRRAIPLDYVTTGEVNLLASPDLSAAKLSGGQLSKGTIVKIAP
ncbi:MAG: hypothetical protein H0W66_00010 [Chthoniobacterales bacterium]|nr:hypothetical protein [Chthoniobacterales bacterium]